MFNGIPCNGDKSATGQPPIFNSIRGIPRSGSKSETFVYETSSSESARPRRGERSTMHVDETSSLFNSWLFDNGESSFRLDSQSDNCSTLSPLNVEKSPFHFPVNSRIERFGRVDKHEALKLGSIPSSPVNEIERLSSVDISDKEDKLVQAPAIDRTLGSISFKMETGPVHPWSNDRNTSFARTPRKRFKSKHSPKRNSRHPNCPVLCKKRRISSSSFPVHSNRPPIKDGKNDSSPSKFEFLPFRSSSCALNKAGAK